MIDALNGVGNLAKVIAWRSSGTKLGADFAAGVAKEMCVF